MSKTTSETEKPLPSKILDHEKPIEFSESFKWSELPATFTAESYHAWLETTLPFVKTMTRCSWKDAGSVIRVGEWRFYLEALPIWTRRKKHFLLSDTYPCRTSLNVYRGPTPRSIRFDAEVSIPVLADAQGKPWMSLAPNEIFTQRGQVRRAKKNTAIAGLGMGWAADKILQRSQVKSLTVYEKDRSILDYFGAILKEKYGDKVKLVRADAYDVDWSQHDVSIWDIWETYGEAAWDRKYLAIRDKLRAEDKTCLGWGEGLTTN